MAIFTVIFSTVLLSVIVHGTGATNFVPYFVKLENSFQVYENEPKGTIVGSVTAQDYEGDLVTLSLEGNGPNLFDIVNTSKKVDTNGVSSTSGKLRLKETLNREERDSYTFVIVAKDDHSSSNREIKREVTLIVRDVNDNSPIFIGTPYLAEIKENTASNNLYEVKAKDADLGSAEIVQFSFTKDCEMADCELFVISTTRGIVSLNTSFTLDYEKRNRYNLDIMAKDRGTPSLNSTKTLVVVVLDESDQPPEFEKSSYRADINENIALDTSVSQTRAFDGDRGINNPVRYTIIGGDDNHYFKIDNATGLISINGSIDRDAGNDYFELIVEATEIPGNASGNTTVFVTVGDVNDNKPTFSATDTPYAVTIPEDTPVGTSVYQVIATDNDREAKNAKFVYSISGDPGHYFIVDPNSGRIKLNKTVDYEKQQQFTFLVVATETQSAERFSTNETVTVDITNVNDNKPKFNESQYNFTVKESAKSGVILGQIIATDHDSGNYGKITYSLSGDGTQKFSVDQYNGTVSVAGLLDFETTKNYDLKLEATDGGKSITRVPVNVVISDVNDNSPIFDALPTSADLNENEDDGSFVTVQASDADSGINSMIRYSIVDGDPLSNFTIDPIHGNITNNGPLDYETKAQFTLVIMAKDLGVPARNSTKTLSVKISDLNDNEPYFNQTFLNVSLMENADIDYPVVRLYGFDKDSGKNAELVYSIVSGNSKKKFTVDADGLILTRSSPDREITPVYTLNVSVSDGGNPKKHAYAKVIVNILDQNDQPPKFQITVDKKVIEEGPMTVNSSVANNTASDGDQGLNGTIKYAIDDGNTEGKFKIDPITGEVTVAQMLDFEEVRIYSLKIVATDQGVSPLSGEYQLVVEVLDINDNDPVFGQPKYSFTVMENRPNGTSIVKLRATDLDSGPNGVITYTITYGNVDSSFSINNETGEILTTKKLDRETKSQYLLIVKAVDHGNPSRQGTTNLTIAVLDENDEIPTFKKSSYKVTVAENTAKGTSIFFLTATDADDGPAGQVSYLMEDTGNLDNGNSVFSIGSKSGEVKTAISLDFEKHRTFTLTITASDNGAPSQSSNVTLLVTIADADDNPPVFTKNAWTAVVSENAAVGAVVTQVNATDNDFEALHRTIYYVISSGNADEVFGIDYENGTVFVANKTWLDRETRDTYELTIEAQTLNEFKNETVQKTTTKLTITVDDYNDYPPVFREIRYSKKIPESFELNEEIMTITADDKDIGKNKEISYFITSGNDKGVFAIDNTTGVITIVKKLDRETTHVHTLTVTARDHGNPSLESNVTVDVSVSDTNDKNPILIIQDTSFAILENATVGTVVARFNATDKDLGKNADVGFRIVSGNNDGIFHIDNHTGELSTVKQLDYEKVHSYEGKSIKEFPFQLRIMTGSEISKYDLYLVNIKIGVQAFDYGLPSLQSEIKVITINVKDVNDNEPTFGSQKSATLSVPENKAPGAIVGTIKGFDDDETDKLYYYMRGGNGAVYFAVDELTGNVTTTANLDREKNATYFIYVAVYNSKQTPEYIASLGPVQGAARGRIRPTVPLIPVESNVQLVTINIADENDNPPYFKYSFYKAGVSENAEYQSRITQITCIDNDKGNNSKLLYKVVDLEPAELLSVESETGWILAGQQQYFASGVGKAYTFKYSCEDPLFTATTNVTIFVLVDDQRVRLTLGINDTEFVRDNIDKIKKALDDATGLEFNVDSIQYHLQDNGRYDLSKTDVFMHAVDPKTNKVVDKDTVLKLIDTNYGRLIGIFQKFKVNAVEPKKPDDEESGFNVMLAAAIALGTILFLILLCFLCVICLMRRSHNRKLRAAKAVGSQDQSYGLSTPGTNLHVYEGSNPIWMDPYDNWKADDDHNSKTAKLFEAQTVMEELEEEDENEDDNEKELPTNGITNPIHNNVKSAVLDLNASGNSNVSDDVFM